FALPPVLTRLRQAEPGIHVEIVASNDQSDLKRREADIAVRAIRPEQPDLIARKLGDVAAYLYAAPSYLDRIGNPETPDGFRDADFVFFENVDRYMDALAMLGLKIERNNFRVSTDNFLVQWEFVKSGAGIGVMPDAVGDAEPAVCRALPSLEPFETELWLVAHRELRTSRRLRLVFDYLARELAV
ncbi:MAG: LysR substrate-binding domain-containing protein, partial [Pseudomonadota bacterium]